MNQFLVTTLLAINLIPAALAAPLGPQGSGKISVIAAEEQVTGGLPHNDVWPTVRRNFNQIKYCYDRALQKDPLLNGKIYVAFKITAKGWVSEPKIDSKTTLLNNELQTCVTGKMARWTFPKPSDGSVTNVVFPFVFAPK